MAGQVIHRASVRQTDSGWWCWCSCGYVGNGSGWTQEQAQENADDHAVNLAV